MIRKKCFYLAAAILSTFTLMISCGSRMSESPVLKTKTSPAKIDRILENFAAKYNADANWTRPLDKIGTDETIYSIDIQDALVNETGEPVLFIGFLRDILVEEGKYFAVFTSTYLDIQFVLECNEVIVTSIRNHVKRKVNEEIAVIAKVDKIDKRESVKVMYPESYDYEIEFGYETFDVFVAKGTCIDFLYTGDVFTRIVFR